MTAHALDRGKQLLRQKLFVTELEFAGLVEDFEQFNQTLLVERDSNNPCRVNVLSNENLVNQFRIYAHAIQFIL